MYSLKATITLSFVDITSSLDMCLMLDPTTNTPSLQIIITSLNSNIEMQVNPHKPKCFLHFESQGIYRNPMSVTEERAPQVSCTKLRYDKSQRLEP
ncbi:hypothetical protein F4779DRAFT_579422 [Xylariaceae sp. FL0662B]|nr:hypothetical protein F4779DRAFT_579422 [Xylariaceae sp. FL0662B]